MKPCIVIPVHNRRQLTLACLSHLAAIGELQTHSVLVVDDGSTDGTSTAIRTRFPTVQVLSGSGDLWWTGAIALGMTQAFSDGATAVCWLNDDCHPELNTLGKLALYAADHPRTIVVPTASDATTGAPIVVGFVGRKPVSRPDNASIAMELDGASGFCVWVPRSVWESIGVPDARAFPHYYGDTSYTLRARKAGGHVTLLSDPAVRLVNYRQRAMTPKCYRERLSESKHAWRATFWSPRSPFRLPTLFNYQCARYGYVAGPALALARGLGWQLDWLTGSVRSRPAQE